MQFIFLAAVCFGGDSVEKLQNRKCQIFLYQSKILKIQSETTVTDSEIDQKRNVRKLATPTAKKYKRGCVRRKLLAHG